MSHVSLLPRDVAKQVMTAADLDVRLATIAAVDAVVYSDVWLTAEGRLRVETPLSGGVIDIDELLAPPRMPR